MSIDKAASFQTITESLTLLSYPITTTGASGVVNASGSTMSLEVGQSVMLKLDGGSAGGFTTAKEYFVTAPSATKFKIAATRRDAFAGTYISGASGNAGVGTIYINHPVGGRIFCGVSGDVNVRGLYNGNDVFTLHKNIPSGSAMEVAIKDINASGTTATSLVIWHD